MEGRHKHFGVKQYFKLLAAGSAFLVGIVTVLWFAGIYLCRTTQYYDIHSGRERICTKWLMLPDRNEIIDTPFSLNAQRQGLVTHVPEWRIFSTRTFPDECVRRCYFTSISELRFLFQACELAQTQQTQRDAMVRAILIEMSAKRDFRVNYDKDMNPIGVTAIGL